MSTEEKSEFKFYIFKKNIFKVPCFKETMLYSSLSWISVSLLTFLLTSRPALASHYGFASYILVSIGYFIPCRVKYYNDQILAEQYKELLHEQNIVQGTEFNEDNKNPHLNVLEDV